MCVQARAAGGNSGADCHAEDSRNAFLLRFQIQKEMDLTQTTRPSRANLPRSPRPQPARAASVRNIRSDDPPVAETEVASFRSKLKIPQKCLRHRHQHRLPQPSSRIYPKPSLC
ncbi:UNVERIFIED_CONTAM: hypothetical protein K2H54_030702 [Gekko kuhli]